MCGAEREIHGVYVVEQWTMHIMCMLLTIGQCI